MRCVLRVSWSLSRQTSATSTSSTERLMECLEMQPGDALVFLASCYHGGGANLVPGAVRKVHGLFFVRGTLRTEENQFLAVPRSKVLGMSPKMLSLLGYTKPTTALGIVDNEDAVKDLEGVLERASR